MIWFLIVAILFVGCGNRQPVAYRPEAIHYYPLALPSSYGRSLIIEQFIEGWHKEEHFQFHSQLEIDTQRVLVLGFTAFQTKIFALRYDGKTVEFENFTDRQLVFPPELILSDIQKVLWPTLPDREGWSIEDAPAEKERLVFFKGKLLTRIRYQGVSPIEGDAELIDLQYGYRLYLRTLNVWSG